MAARAGAGGVGRHGRRGESCQLSGAGTDPDPGLIARYELVDSWLSELRSHLLNGQQVNGQQVNALVLLIANETTTAGAIIDGITIPSAERGRQQRVCAYPERLA